MTTTPPADLVAVLQAARAVLDDLGRGGRDAVDFAPLAAAVAAVDAELTAIADAAPVVTPAGGPRLVDVDHLYDYVEVGGAPVAEVAAGVVVLTFRSSHQRAPELDVPFLGNAAGLRGFGRIIRDGANRIAHLVDHHHRR